MLFAALEKARHHITPSAQQEVDRATRFIHGSVR
jgi:hypothetical protein